MDTQAAHDSLRRTVKVVVPAAEMQAALNAKVEEVRRKANLKGFRPGKAPASHIRKLYGRSMMQDIIQEELRNRSDKAIAEAQIRLAGEPRLQIESDMNAVATGAADLAFSLEMDVMPDFTPPDPATLVLERPVAPVTDALIEKTLATVAEANRPLVEKDGPAAEKDVLTIDFIGRIDGEAFEGGSADGAQITLGSGQFIPGFEDQLVGATKGEERVVSVTFPEDYAVESLKGKAAAFEVTVQDVRAFGEPEVNDALAERMGLENAEKLRELVKERLEQDHAAMSRAKAKRALFDQLDASLDFPLPPAMLEAEFNEIWRQIEADRTSGALDDEDKDKSEDELRASYKRIAERRVRLGLVLAEIGNRNNIQVRDEELAAALNAQARRFPGREQQVIDLYRRNPQALAQLRAPIFEEKVVDYILELATVTDKEVTREELEAEDPAPE